MIIVLFIMEYKHTNKEDIKSNIVNENPYLLSNSLPVISNLSLYMIPSSLLSSSIEKCKRSEERSDERSREREQPFAPPGC